MQAGLGKQTAKEWSQLLGADPGALSREEGHREDLGGQTEGLARPLFLLWKPHWTEATSKLLWGIWKGSVG